MTTGADVEVDARIPTSTPDALLRENEALRRENEALRREIEAVRGAASVAADAATTEGAVRARMYQHFTAAPFAVAAFVGPDHVVDFANEMALRAWGKERSRLGKPLLEILPELRDQPFIGYLDRIRATGVPYRGFAELARLVRTPGGEAEDAYYDFVYSPMRLSDGTVDGILMFSFDVTEQVEAHNERLRLVEMSRATERHFRDLIDHLPDLAWTTGPDGRADFYNRRWYEYTGTTMADDIALVGPRAVRDPDVLARIRDRWKKSLATGEPFEMEYPLHGADGVARWFLTRIRPLRDATGRIHRWVGTNTDIDDRKREEGFRETFLAVLGHDLRNPLSAILTTARLMAKRGTGHPASDEQVERVIRSGVRMQRMIDQLLDLTRARLAGGIPLVKTAEPMELAPTVARIVDEIRSAHPDHTIDVHIDERCRARLDADRFEQVVSNLLVNAVVHGDPQTPVRVFLEAQGQDVIFRVENGGAPIAAEFLPHLFNPFARNSKPSGRSLGLGLGLYISERIVDGHGGKVMVHSSVEEGTRFAVFLPAESPP